MLESADRKDQRQISHEIIFEVFQPTFSSSYLNVTDRQIDRRLAMASPCYSCLGGIVAERWIRDQKVTHWFDSRTGRYQVN